MSGAMHRFLNKFLFLSKFGNFDMFQIRKQKIGKIIE